MSDSSPGPLDPILRPASEIVAALGTSTEGSLEIGSILEAFGSRAHALAMLVLALPETVPLPLPSASLILGIPLMAIAVHLSLFGEQSVVPGFIRRRRIPASAMAGLAKYGVPALRALERISQPRWRFLAAQTRLAGVFCAWLAFILFLPLPLANIAPASCILLISLGLLLRDGLMIALGMMLSAILTAGLGYLGNAILAFLGSLFSPLTQQ